jgi:hypothetical protein
MAGLGAAVLVGSGLGAPPAKAAYIVTLMQQGSNVVATGSGTVNTVDLTQGPTITGPNALINPNEGELALQLTNMQQPFNLFTGITGPASFGSGGLTNADSSSESPDAGRILIDGSLGQLAVSTSAFLSNTATWDNATLNSLGVTPGTYVWTWGTGTDADSFTLDVVAPASVPEPASVALLAVPLGLIIGLAVRRHRAASPTA